MAIDEHGVEWRQIQGFPNYSVSDDGRVRRETLAPKGSFSSGDPPFQMTLQLNSKGYRHIGLTRDGVQVTHLVSRLVCQAFHGEPPSAKHEAAHWDGDQENNRASNLRWATTNENHADRYRHGTTAKKISREAVFDIRKRVAAKERCSVLAEEYGVSAATIYHIVRGKTWKWLKSDDH